jgi:hypothetical protein
MAKNYNSAKSNTSTAVKKKSLIDLTTPLSPKTGLQRMMRNRLANMNAIPGVAPISSIPLNPNPEPTPRITSAIEITTQSELALMTQSDKYLVIQ